MKLASLTGLTVRTMVAWGMPQDSCSLAPLARYSHHSDGQLGDLIILWQDSQLLDLLGLQV